MVFVYDPIYSLNQQGYRFLFQIFEIEKDSTFVIYILHVILLPCITLVEYILNCLVGRFFHS